MLVGPYIVHSIGIDASLKKFSYNVQLSLLTGNHQKSTPSLKKNKTHKKPINKTNTGQLKHFEASHLKNNKESSPPPK